MIYYLFLRLLVRLLDRRGALSGARVGVSRGIVSSMTATSAVIIGKIFCQDLVQIFLGLVVSRGIVLGWVLWLVWRIMLLCWGLSAISNSIVVVGVMLWCGLDGTTNDRDRIAPSHASSRGRGWGGRGDTTTSVLIMLVCPAIVVLIRSKPVTIVTVVVIIMTVVADAARTASRPATLSTSLASVLSTSPEIEIRN